MLFEISLVRKGIVTADDFVRALEMQIELRQPIGRICLEQKRLTMNQLFLVLAEGTGQKLPFGEIAIQLGFLTREDLAEMLLVQSERTPTLSECLVQAGALDGEELERERRLFRLLTVEESSHTMIRSEGPRAAAI